MQHGRAAKDRQLPWHVSVGVRRNRGPALTAFEGHRGGGTIIGTRWVLTAAHVLADVSDLLTPDGCLETTRHVRLTVASGRNLDAPAREVDVTFARVHPQFDPGTLACDAALLRLAEDVDGGISLADDSLTPGRCGIVAGWGAPHAASRIVPHLAWARVHAAAEDSCATLFAGRVRGRPHLMFAAGGPAACCPEFPRAVIQKGDSGGGFVVRRASAHYLHGIVSWSASLVSGTEGPHVLTRTLPLADWIASSKRS